jgi:hypothetical protein
MRFTREQLQLLSDVLWTHQDEGPAGSGWASAPVAELRAKVDAALAEPEPEGPTVMEIIGLADEIEAAELGQVDLVRAALSRWGNYPAIPDSSPLPS